MGLSDFLFGKAPQVAQIDKGANVQQANQAFGNTQMGLDQQQAFLQALQGQNGIQNQSNVYNQLALQAAGQGPNPAQAMLQNATGANVANQAALMAGQRGAGANAGLIARQAGMQGGAIQQQAAGQGALMQAQQQLGALGQMGNIAGQQVQNLGQSGQAYSQAANAQQGNVLNALGQQNAQMVASQNAVNEQNSKRGFANVLGGIASAIPGVGSLFGGGGGGSNSGGGVSSSAGSPSLGVDTSMGSPQYKLAQGGEIPENGPKSNVGRHLKGMTRMAAGGSIGATLKSGGGVPGQAKVKGDSLKNDTVAAKLSPGEIVIPRSVAQSKNAPEAAAKFVAAILAKKSKK